LRAEQLAAVSRISAQIAHEIRNPLSSIGLNIEMPEEAYRLAAVMTLVVGIDPAGPMRVVESAFASLR
jgi:signal transduction histidine kinase